MPRLDADRVRKLAAKAQPLLVFDRRERFFPVRAEAWLTHATSQPWTGQADVEDIAALPPDPHHRGTALCESSENVVDHTKLGGPPNAADTPLLLEESDDPNAIGNFDYRASVSGDRERFLTFGGWLDSSKPAAGGDINYVYEAFSELASAMNHEVPWLPAATADNRPWFGQPQPPSPAVYCEFDWAGAHPLAAQRNGQNAFAGAGRGTPLDRLWQLTYYYLFPAREAAAGQPDKRLEGQWCAVSVFYEASGNIEPTDQDGRLVEGEIADDARPVWIVLSIGDGDRPKSMCRRFGAPETEPVEREGGTTYDSVRVYVCAGTHRLLPFRSPENVPFTNEPWPALDYQPGDDAELLWPIVAVGAMLGSLPPGVVQDFVTGAAGGGALAAGGFWPILIVLLILILLNEVSELWDDDADTGWIPDAAEPPIAPGGEVGHPNAPAAPPDPAPQPGGAWPTSSGAPDGRDRTYFDRRTISRVKAALEKDLEPPPWWHFGGRWGIKVPDSPGWESGTRRTDGSEQSLAYWHAAALLDRIMKETPAPHQP
jgi:hypothetical protein